MGIQKRPPDFTGVATAYGVKCTDGRTIAHGAFSHQDGQRLPMIWSHGHTVMQNVVGHVILHAGDEKVGVDAWFNRTATGKDAKEMVQNGDIQYLSIYANQIVQDKDNIVHKGEIREVSLVLAGANPGAVIENVVIHGDGFDPDEVLQDEVMIHSGIEISIDAKQESEEEEEVVHKEDDSETIGDIFASFNDDQIKLVEMVLEHSLGSTPEFKEGSAEGPTFQEVFDSLSEKQKNVLYEMAGHAAEEASSEAKHSDDLGEIDMDTTTHNIFESKEVAEQHNGYVLSHEDGKKLLADAMRTNTSLRQNVLRHAGTYGLDNISVLFPDAKGVNPGGPVFQVEDQVWVANVLNKARKTPFSRIKSMYATITADEARAKGYVTGAEKFDEVFPLFSRTTTPQTIYKKQRLDRDDLLDITDFDVVRWLKSEMQLKLREELARAILVGDGRSGASADKIQPTNIRPIYGDDAVYTHVHTAFAAADDVLDIIDGVVAARSSYKGTGNPTLFVTPGLLTSMLLVRDTTNRRIYGTKADLAAAMMVSDIVEVPFMTGITRVDTNTYTLLAILVNMQDYTIGADKGGQTSFFQSFDIDFNQEKYLYESRVSGALTVPKSAVVFEQSDV